MGFVKSQAEVDAIRSTLTGVEFLGGEMLTVDALIAADQAAALLPPGLTPAETPRLTVTVGRWRSNCCGDFAGGAVYIAARHGDIEADYVLTMFMDSDVPMIFGRDLYGEPKKLASATLYRNGDHMSGSVERLGTRLIEIEADLGPDSGPSASVGRNFNVKALLSADGTGLQSDPELTVAEFESRVSLHRPAVGRLTLRGTRHDPLDELNVLEVIGARYVEADMKATCRGLGTIDASEFLPYAYGRMDDWSELATAHAPW